MLRPAVHGHWFCTALHLGLWYKVLSKQVEDKEEAGQSDTGSDEEGQGNVCAVLEAVQVPLKYTKSLDMYMH